ncbi:MAG: hypothetical protein ACREKL_01805, partial [Chthoniobacterales bacterium]
AGMEPVIVVINASDKERITGTPGHLMKLLSAAGKSLFAQGDKLERVPIAGFDGDSTSIVELEWKDGLPQVGLPVAPESVSIFRKAR